jgi:DNA-binding NarL/FixJ family response regulator
VVVVDDQAPFRAAARSMFDRLPEFELIAEATSGEAAVALCATARPDLVLMDVHLGGIDGIEAARRLQQGRHRPVVVLVSSHDATDLPAAAATCGAWAYTAKDELSGRWLRDVWGRAAAR